MVGSELGINKRDGKSRNRNHAPTNRVFHVIRKLDYAYSISKRNTLEFWEH